MLRRTNDRGGRRRIVAGSDCETCRPGVITQPVNTASSLAYVVAGADLLRRPDPDRAFAWAMIAVGVGSVAYHGPGGVVGRWMHDASLLAMLGLLTASDLTLAEGRRLRPEVVGAVATVAAVTAHPRTSEVAQGVAGLLAALAEGRRYSQSTDLRELWVSLPLWAGGFTLHILGRTGQPWCRPSSLLQPHGAWHVVSATALWSRRRVSGRVSGRVRSSGRP